VKSILDSNMPVLDLKDTEYDADIVVKIASIVIGHKK
jgi:hypothetical protein